MIGPSACFHCLFKCILDAANDRYAIFSDSIFESCHSHMEPSGLPLANILQVSDIVVFQKQLLQSTYALHEINLFLDEPTAPHVIEENLRTLADIHHYNA